MYPSSARRLRSMTVGGTSAMATEALHVHSGTDVAVRSFRDSVSPQRADLSTISEATQSLIHELAGRPTDLMELVDAVRCRPRHVVAIPAEAVIHWRKDESHSWE